MNKNFELFISECLSSKGK